MRIVHVSQNSEEWFTERQGKITGSRVNDTLISKIAGKTELVDYVVEHFGVDQKEAKKWTLPELTEKVTEKDYRDFYHESAKKEYWRILAEKAGYSDADEDGIYEDPRDRGHRLEDMAADKASAIVGVQAVAVGMCAREDYSEIAVSPDRLIPDRELSEKELAILTLDPEDEEKIKLLDSLNFVGGMEIKNPGVANHLEIVFTNKIPSEYHLQVVQYFVAIDSLEYVLFVSHNPNVISKQVVIIKATREEYADEIASSKARQIKTIEMLNKDVMDLTF